MEVIGNQWWIPCESHSGKDETERLKGLGFQVESTLGNQIKVTPPKGWTIEKISTGYLLLQEAIIKDATGMECIKCVYDEADDYDPDPYDDVYLTFLN